MAFVEPSLKCDAVTELLPWLMRGSLALEEETQVRAHLAVCADCCTELVEFLEVQELLDAHLPSMEIARYSQGLPLESLSRERVERHLSTCSSCSEEAQLAASDCVVGIDEAPRRSLESHWQKVKIGLAASLAAAVLGWGLFSTTGGEFGQTRTTDTPSSATDSLGTGNSIASAGNGNNETTEDQVIGAKLFLDGFETGRPELWSEVQD